MKRALNILSGVLLAAVIVLAVLLVGVRVVGITPYVVLSDSMAPEFRTGAIVYTQPVSASQVQVGDIITFRVSDDVVASHRVIEVSGSGEDASFTTKGDANEVADSTPVTAGNLVGRVVFTLPALGAALEFVHTTPGMVVAVAVGLLIILLIALPGIIWPAPRKNTGGSKRRAGTSAGGDGA